MQPVLAAAGSHATTVGTATPKSLKNALSDARASHELSAWHSAGPQPRAAGHGCAPEPWPVICIAMRQLQYLAGSCMDS